MGLSKQSEKYWKGSETFGMGMSSIFSRGNVFWEAGTFSAYVFWLYSEDIFLKMCPF